MKELKHALSSFLFLSLIFSGGSLREENTHFYEEVDTYVKT